MYHHEHDIAHFHVTHGEFDATIAVETGDILAGKLPRRIRRLLERWRKLHKDELLANRERAMAGKPLTKIEPLE